jgi:membrane protein
MKTSDESAPAQRVHFYSLIKESVAAWKADFAPSMGAGLAYYAVFSIASLVIIVMAMAGFFFGPDAATGKLYAEVVDLAGLQVASAVQTLVESASKSEHGTLATVLGAALLVLGASSVFSELKSDLDRIFKAPAAQESQGLWDAVRSRAMALVAVGIIGVVMIASLVVSTALAAFAKPGENKMAWLVHGADLVASLAVITVMFALVYKLLPRARLAWPDVWVGAFVTAALFTIGKFAIGLYLGRSNVASSFGAAGSLAALLLWIYYSSQIFLLGAEFTWVYANRFGSRRPRAADPHASTDPAVSNGLATRR